MARELSIREAWLNSDIEAMAEALADESPEDNLSAYPNYITADDGNYDHLDQVEGWDGEPLSDAEQWEAAINGPLDSGFDRPLQLAEDMELADALDARDAEIASLRQINAELAHRADPMARQRAQQAREEALYDIIANPEQAANAIVGLQERNNEMAASRVNASMHAAHARYGHEFARAYQNLTGTNPNHPAARALVQSIYNAQDPGQALMEWHQSTGGRPIPVAVGGGARTGRRLPPSLSSGERSSAYRGRRAPERSSSSPSSWPVGADAEAADGNAAQERDIMEYALA